MRSANIQLFSNCNFVIQHKEIEGAEILKESFADRKQSTYSYCMKILKSNINLYQTNLIKDNMIAIQLILEQLQTLDMLDWFNLLLKFDKSFLHKNLTGSHKPQTKDSWRNELRAKHKK